MHLSRLHALPLRLGGVVEQEEMNGTLDGELAVVLSSIATACKQIASLVTRAGISNLTGLAGAANIQVSPTHMLPGMLPIPWGDAKYFVRALNKISLVLELHASTWAVAPNTQQSESNSFSLSIPNRWSRARWQQSSLAAEWKGKEALR